MGDKALRLFFVSILCLSLFACTNGPRSFELSYATQHKSLPTVNSALFEWSPVISQAEITYLSHQQKEDFFAFFNNPKFANTPKHERVASYIGILLDQFTYSDRTLSAQQSLALQSGNCLSLTILTTALAELAGVDLSYQLLDQNPVYSIDNNLLITSNHLRAVLKSASVRDGYSGTIFSSRIKIDYFQTDGLSYVDDISTDFQMSLFYSNLAIEKLSEREIDAAFSYASEALKVHQYNPSALNVLGIVHRQRGDLAKAEEIYEHGARYFADAPTFVNNYTALLKSQSRGSELSSWLNEMPENQNNHPWAWVKAGKAAYSKGNFDIAVSYYQRALDLAPDLHQVYAFAGAASYAAGRERESQNYIDQALALAGERGDRQRYKGKLRAFEY